MTSSEGQVEEEKEEIVDAVPEDGLEVEEENVIEPLDEEAALSRKAPSDDEEQGAYALPADPPGEHVDERPKPAAVSRAQPESPVDEDDEEKDETQPIPWYRNKQHIQIAGIVLIVVILVVVLAVVLRVVFGDEDDDDSDTGPTAGHSTQWIALDRGDTLNGGNEEDILGWSVALSAQGNVLAAGAPQGIFQNLAGYVKVWEWAVSDEDAAAGSFQPSWIPRGFPIANGLSGYAVALNGDGSILAFGEIDTTDDSGMVCVRQWNLLTWQTFGPCISNPNRNFGQSIALSTDGYVLAIGSKESTLVEVWVFDKSNFTWTQLGETLKGDESSEHGGGHSGMDGVGTALDMNSDGTIVAIGGMDQVSVWQWKTSFSTDAQETNSMDNDSNATLPLSQWERKGDPVGTPAPGVSDWQTGGSVSLSADGNTMAVGVSGNDGNGPDSGHVQVWEWTANGWEPKGDEIRGEADFDYFGFSVALAADGDTLIAGAPEHDGVAADTGRPQRNSGNSRVFEWSGDEWVLKGDRIMGDGLEDDNSGRSVAISDNGSIVAVGAPFHATNGNGRAGIVRVYEIDDPVGQR